MTTIDRINAYAETPQSVPVARYHMGSAIIRQRRASTPWPGFAAYAEQAAATRTLWRRLGRMQTRARNRLDWAEGDRSTHSTRDQGSALLFALLLITACFLTGLGIAGEVLARAHGIG